MKQAAEKAELLEARPADDPPRDGDHPLHSGIHSVLPPDGTVVKRRRLVEFARSVPGLVTVLGLLYLAIVFVVPIVVALGQ